MTKETITEYIIANHEDTEIGLNYLEYVETDAMIVEWFSYLVSIGWIDLDTYVDTTLDTFISTEIANYIDYEKDRLGY